MVPGQGGESVKGARALPGARSPTSVLNTLSRLKRPSFKKKETYVGGNTIICAQFFSAVGLKFVFSVLGVMECVAHLSA